LRSDVGLSDFGFFFFFFEEEMEIYLY